MLCCRGKEMKVAPSIQMRKTEETPYPLSSSSSSILNVCHVLDVLLSILHELIQSSQLYEVDFIIFSILKLGKLRLIDVQWCLLVT